MVWLMLIRWPRRVRYLVLGRYCLDTQHTSQLILHTTVDSSCPAFTNFNAMS